jgi:hypothetical protein
MPANTSLPRTNIRLIMAGAMRTKLNREKTEQLRANQTPIKLALCK